MRLGAGAIRAQSFRTDPLDESVSYGTDTSPPRRLIWFCGKKEQPRKSIVRSVIAAPLSGKTGTPADRGYHALDGFHDLGGLLGLGVGHVLQFGRIYSHSIDPGHHYSFDSRHTATKGRFLMSVTT